MKKYQTKPNKTYQPVHQPVTKPCHDQSFTLLRGLTSLTFIMFSTFVNSMENIYCTCQNYIHF